MRVSTAVTLALSALLATSLLGVAAAAPAPAQLGSADDRLPTDATRSASAPATPSMASSLTATQSDLESLDPKQVIRVEVTADGDVRWTIESRFLLTDDEDEAVFDEYADELRNGQRDVSYDQFDSFRRAAQEETGRQMSLENAGWDEQRIVSPDEADGIEDGDIPETDEETSVRVGIVSYSFTWTNFAVVDDDRIYFGDALIGFSTLTDGQRLVIEYPDDFALETPTELVWDGPYEFSDGEREIVFVRTGSAEGLSLGWLLGGLFALIVVIGLGYLFVRRDTDLDQSAPTERLPDRIVRLGEALTGRPRSDTSKEQRASISADTDGGSVRSTRDPAADGVGADRSTGDAGTELEYEEDGDDGIDPELLSDEERVLRLLKQNGGRMKQGSIVSETGWSNAKVSQLLSKMDDDDDIEKLRIGRENLITLPEVDPTELD